MINRQFFLRKFIIIFFQFAALIVTFVCFCFNRLDGYNWLWCLPVTFFFAFTYFGYKFWLKNRFFNNLILYLINIVCFLKYVITPLSMIFQEYFGTWGGEYGMWGPTPTTDVLTKAIFLECGEVIFVYLTYIVCMRRHGNKIIQSDYVKDNNVILFKNRFIIYLFCAVSFIYIILVSPGSLSLKSLISVTETSPQIVDINHPGIVIVFKQIFLISLMLILLDCIYKKIKNDVIKIMLSYLVLAIYMSLNMSYSRWDLLFALIAGSYIIYLYYGKKVLKYSVLLACIAIIGMLAISRIKFMYALEDTASTQSLISMLFGQMQDYFSGPRLVAQSIEVSDKFQAEIGFSTIINDLFGNVPIISDFFDQENRINRYFCYYNFNTWGNTSLLMPMLGETYCYVPFFPWLLSVFYSALIFKLDILSRKTQYLEFRYLYVLEECWLAFALCLNSQTNWGHIIQVFIFPGIIFWLNKKITIKGRKQKHSRI